MVSREDVLQSFQTKDGRIISPGKFEGEAIYVPFFWAKVLDGWADEEDEDGASLFYVTVEETVTFPELGGRKVLKLREDDQGFVRELPVSNL